MGVEAVAGSDYSNDETDAVPSCVKRYCFVDVADTTKRMLDLSQFDAITLMLNLTVFPAQQNGPFRPSSNDKRDHRCDTHVRDKLC